MNFSGRRRVGGKVMEDIKIIQMHITELKLRNQLKSGDLEVALTRAMSALEKQIKISRTVIEGEYFCPRCKCLMFYSGYCKNCGQNTY